MKKSTPYRCPVCVTIPGEFYGKLLFEDEEIPICPNHRIVNGDGTVTEKEIRLVPSAQA